MALTVRLYHTVEQLMDCVDILFERQKHAGLLGRQPRLITLSQPINRWVNSMLTSRHGASIELDSLLMEDGLWSILRDHSPVELPQAINFQQWLMRISCALADEDFLALPVMQPVKQYLEGTDKSANTANKREGFAQALLLLFQDYEQRSPDILDHWPDTPIAQAEREIYLRCAAGDPCSLWNAFCQIRHMSPVEAADRCYTAVLGFADILPGQWQILEWASTVTDIEVFVFHPASVGDAGLASWMQPTSEFIERAKHCCIDNPHDGDDCLDALKAVVTSGQLSIISAKGTDREYEVVANHVLKLMDEHPELLPHEIAVMCSDISDILGTLRIAFDKYYPHLPYCVMGARDGDSLYIQAAKALLNLSAESFTRSGLLSIMRSPCFLQAHGITTDVVENWQTLMQNTGALRGYAHSMPPYNTDPSAPFSFKQMLQRYRLGRLMDIPSELDDTEWQHRIPEALARTSTDELELLGVCLEHTDALAKLLSGASRSAADWSKLLQERLSQLIQPQDDNPADQRGMRQLARVFQLMTDPQELISSQMLDASSYKALLWACIRPDAWHLGNPVVGGVNVGSLNQLAGIPYRHIILCGMNEGSFPQRSHRTSLDVRTAADQHQQDVSRQALFTAMLHASDSITISYQGLDPVTDVQGYFSYQLQQLIEQLGANMADISREAPLMPYSTPYVVKDSETKAVWPNYSSADWLVALKQLCSGTTTDAALRGQAQKALEALLENQTSEHEIPTVPPIDCVSTKQLASFMYNPVRGVLERLAGRVWEDEAEDDSDSEPLQISGYRVSNIVSQVISSSLQKGVEVTQAVDDVYHAYSHRGLLPVHPVDAVMVDNCKQAASAAVAGLPAGNWQPLKAHTEVDGITVTADWPMCIMDDSGSLTALKVVPKKKKTALLYPSTLVEPALSLLVQALQENTEIHDVSIWLFYSDDKCAERFTLHIAPEYLSELVRQYCDGKLWDLRYSVVDQLGLEATLSDWADELDAQSENSTDNSAWIEGVTLPDSDQILRDVLSRRWSPFVKSDQTMKGEQ